MKRWKEYAIVISPSTIIIALLLAIFGYFEFGGTAGILAIFGFALTTVVVSFVGIVPFFGLPLYIILTLMWTSPYWYKVSPLHQNWLTIMIWILGLINCILFYIESTEQAIKKLE